MSELPVAAYEVRRAPPPKLPRVIPIRKEAVNTGFRSALTPSRFNVAVDLPDGRIAVYNTFSAALTIMHRAGWQRVLAPGARVAFSVGTLQAAMSRLLANGFLVAEGTDETEMVRQHYQRGRRDRSSGFSANVLLTMACNLACQYCFQGKIQMEAQPRMMAPDTEEAVVEYLKRSASNTRMLRVSWFGGEPLLGLRQIKRMSPSLVEFCDKSGIAYEGLITTNGVLLDREAVDVLVQAHVSQAQVSVDVPAELKNDKQDRGTQEQVLNNLVYAAERIPSQLRVNLTHDDESEWEALFDGLVRRGLDKTLRSVFIAHVYQPEGARCDGVGSPDAPEAYVAVLKRQYERAQELGLPMTWMVASSCSSGCAATSENSVSIDPDGLLYKCPDDAGRADRAYGSVFLDSITSSENWFRWLNYDWFQYEDCRSCTMLPQCAGGCPHQRIFQPKRNNDMYCYWYLRGDLEDRIRETVKKLLEGHAARKSAGELCGV